MLQARGIPRHHSSGWLLQQFIKLAGFPGDTDFFVIDADTVLTNRYVIKCDGCSVFREWDWREFHYCSNYRGLTGLWPVTYFTTVHHMMFFDGSSLRQMKSFLEDKYACGWTDAILNHIPNDDFSEYTLFSQWALGHKECYLADVNQKNEFHVDFSRFKSLEDIERAYPHVDAVSFHNLNI